MAKSPKDLAAEALANIAAERDYHTEARKLLKRGAVSVPDLAKALNLPESLARALITDITHAGANVQSAGELWSISKNMPPATIAGDFLELTTDKNGWLTFGACGDTHLCSKYERLDILNDMYDAYAAEGVKHVFHTGNWVDGEDPQKAPPHELLAHGMTPQLQYLAKNYPQRKGITTYAVAGDDHEGWWQQREGIDIGRTAEMEMEKAGRKDWVNLGYQAAHVKITHGRTGESCVLLVEHPGGGSSYADSYTAQKLVEALDGGEKPALALWGHYHKLLAGIYRSVCWVQTGCTKDRDSFGRKKKLRYVKGGAMVRIQLDDKAAIKRFQPELLQYFNKGYYNDLHGLDPQHPKAERTP